MKRILIFLLILTAGTGLFAQGLKINGYFNSGLGVIATNRDGVNPNPAFTAFGVDSWQPGYRFRLNGAYTNGANNAGVKFRFQSQGVIQQSGALSGASFTIPYVYGWVSFIDNVITLNGGLVDDATWDTGGVLLGRNGADQGEGLGALVKISPIEGLDLGVAAYGISARNGTDQAANVPFDVPGFGMDDVKYVANFGYTVPDLLKIIATFRTANSSTGITKTQSSRAIAGIGLLAVENLTALVEAELNNLQNFSNTGTISFYETLGYRPGDVGFGLNAGQHLSQSSAQSDMGLEFAPWIDITLGSVVPRLDLVYFLGGTADLLAPQVRSYHRVGYKPTYNTNVDVLSVRPSVKFNIGDDGATFIEMGDVVYFANVLTNSAKSLTNVFYVDFKWSF
jgi:hypothetical protein